MWDLGAGDLIAGAIGVLGLIVGSLGLRKAGAANTIAADSGTAARQAVEKADTANRLSETANGIATGANALSQESIVIAREANAIAQRAAEVNEEGVRLQRAGMSANEAREWRKGQAILRAQIVNLRTSLGEQGSFDVMVENRGVHQAIDLEANYLADGSTYPGGMWKALTPGGPAWTMMFSLGWLYGAGISEPYGGGEDLAQREKEGELRITFTDGNGHYIDRKRIIWEAGKFPNRQVRIEHLPVEPAPAP